MSELYVIRWGLGVGNYLMPACFRTLTGEHRPSHARKFTNRADAQALIDAEGWTAEVVSYRPEPVAGGGEGER